MNTNTHSNIDWGQVVRPALLSLIVFTVVLGLAYPAAITGIAQVIFPHQANGSLITDIHGTIIGSELIGQQFSDPAYFWGRLSATSPEPYNAAASSGSNFGPINPALIGNEGTMQTRIDALRAAETQAGVDHTAPIPVDLVTASASGLDPQISPAAAAYQVARVAALRDASVGEVQALIDAHTEGRWLGLLGEPRVNVLELNLALDQAFPLSAAR